MNNLRDERLHSKAEEFSRLVEATLVSPSGLLFSLLNADNLRPFPKGFFDGKHTFDWPGSTLEDFSEWTSFENSGMVTGGYLSACVWNLRAEPGNGRVRAIANRLFAVLRDHYRACSEVEPGFFCKPYGGRITDQVSSDQYLYVITALDLYASIASPSDRREAGRIIGEMVGWWIRRGYTYPYFGKPMTWPLERFPVFAWLAFKHTGEAGFRDEFERLCATAEVREKVPFVKPWSEVLQIAGTRKPYFEFEERTGHRTVMPRAEGVGSGFLSIGPLLEEEPSRVRLWISKAEVLFEVALNSIGTDGLELPPVMFDPAAGTFYEVKTVLRPGNPYWKLMGFVGWIKSGMGAAMAARALAGMQRHLVNHNGLSLAGDILGKIGIEQMRWRIDADGRQYPADIHWAGNVFSGDAIVNWLWAYWEARARHGRNWIEKFAIQNRPEGLATRLKEVAR